MRKLTLALVVKGGRSDLKRLLRFVQNQPRLRLVYRRLSHERLWVFSDRELEDFNDQPRGKEGKILIDDELFSLEAVRRIEKEWQDSGIFI
jgi:hypothetical protein